MTSHKFVGSSCALLTGITEVRQQIAIDKLLFIKWMVQLTLTRIICAQSRVSDGSGSPLERNCSRYPLNL